MIVSIKFREGIMDIDPDKWDICEIEAEKFPKSAYLLLERSVKGYGSRARQRIRVRIDEDPELYKKAKDMVHYHELGRGIL